MDIVINAVSVLMPTFSEVRAKGTHVPSCVSHCKKSERTGIVVVKLKYILLVFKHRCPSGTTLVNLKVQKHFLKTPLLNVMK